MSADPTGLVARLRKLDCCAVSDAIDRLGLDSGVVTGLLQQGSGASRIAGRAITLKLGVGTPKAGVFAEGAARTVAAGIIARLQGGPSPEAYKGQGACYVELGHNQVGRVDVDFLSGPKPTGTFQEPSDALVAEKAFFGSSRVRRWFGRTR